MLGLATTLLSPPLRVRTVVWTGGSPLPPELCQRAETLVLGKPLFVLPRKQLHDLVEVDLEVELRPPSTLELRSEAPGALAVLGAGGLVAADGRIVAGEPRPGLVRLEGVDAGAGAHVEPPVQEFLTVLRRELGSGPLAPLRARHEGDEWELWLGSGSRVRLLAADVDAQLRKLRIFEQGLRDESLPARIDLRFEGQVVGRVAEGGRRG
jgi:hypothetical protein